MKIKVKDTPEFRELILNCNKNGNIDEGYYKLLLSEIEDVCKQICLLKIKEIEKQFE